MKLKHPVTSLKLSERLKELSPDQVSCFIGDWRKDVDGEGFFRLCCGWNTPDAVYAFTIGESGKMLPERITVLGVEKQRGQRQWDCRKDSLVFLRRDPTPKPSPRKNADLFIQNKVIGNE
jgi:hypothetical protein